MYNDGVTPIAWATSAVTSNLVYGPQGADRQLTTTSTGMTSSWLYLDRQRTIRVTAGSDSLTTSASAYSDFGVLEPAAGTLYAGAGTEAAPGQEDKLAAVHLPVSATRTPVGYTGEQTNPVAGLQHYFARDYQPALASWIQADTWAGDSARPGTLNKYAYVINNPVTLTDWMGDRPWDPAYDVRSDGRGSWNLQPKPGVTAADGSTPPSFNWADPGRPAPEPWVSNEPTDTATDATSQSGPSSHSGRYSEPPCAYNNYISSAACRLPDGTRYPSGGGTGSTSLLNIIDCAVDMNVGMDPRQVAINQACGNAITEAAMLTAPQWQRDLWAIQNAINGVLQPAVPLIVITAGMGGVGAVGETRPPLSCDPKITGQMPRRGWTTDSVESTVRNPARTYTVNNKTGAVVQVSDVYKAGWKPVWEDPRFIR